MHPRHLGLGSGLLWDTCRASPHLPCATSYSISHTGAVPGNWGLHHQDPTCKKAGAGWRRAAQGGARVLPSFHAPKATSLLFMTRTRVMVRACESATSRPLNHPNFLYLAVHEDKRTAGPGFQVPASCCPSGHHKRASKSLVEPLYTPMSCTQRPRQPTHLIACWTLKCTLGRSTGPTRCPGFLLQHAIHGSAELRLPRVTGTPHSHWYNTQSS